MFGKIRLIFYLHMLLLSSRAVRRKEKSWGIGGALLRSVDTALWCANRVLLLSQFAKNPDNFRRQLSKSILSLERKSRLCLLPKEGGVLVIDAFGTILQNNATAAPYEFWLRFRQISDTANRILSRDEQCLSEEIASLLSHEELFPSALCVILESLTEEGYTVDVVKEALRIYISDLEHYLTEWLKEEMPASTTSSNPRP